MYKVKFLSAAVLFFLALSGLLIYIFHSYYTLALFLIVVPISIAALMLGYVSNRSLLQRASWQQRWDAAKNAARSYLPLLATLCLGVIAQAYISYTVREELYAQKVVLQAEADARPNAILFGGRAFDADMKFTFDKHVDDAASRARLAIDDLIKVAGISVERARSAIPQAMAQIFDRELITGCRRGTGWLCRRVNRSYRAGVQRQNAKLQGELNVIAEKATKSRREASTAADKLIETWKVEAKAIAHAAVDNLFASLSVLSGLAILGLLMAVVKSFGYLFSRWLLTSNNLTQNFASPELRSRRADFDLPVQANRLEVDLEEGCRFYVSTNLNFLGDIEKKSIPKWASIVSNRILQRLYVLHRIDGRQDQLDLVVEADLGDQFVRVELRESEELFFNIRYLCGFSEAVTFSKYVNFRAIAMIFGRLTYLSATGPGTIIFLVPGGCVVVGQDQEFLQHRLVAWKSTARFSVRSSLKIRDLYFSGASISPSVDRTCVIENATGRKHRRYVSRFFRRFLWPL